ncbi:hypothetical protein [Novosphingobium rosa]|uniref:hypothetical protein n=1 Tax=Novosphingobium rosa TaxID=76978 RepID=UPI0008377C89|nr:hypothetical protein [Novosphingobium rosa]
MKSLAIGVAACLAVSVAGAATQDFSPLASYGPGGRYATGTHGLDALPSRHQVQAVRGQSVRALSAVPAFAQADDALRQGLADLARASAHPMASISTGCV